MAAKHTPPGDASFRASLLRNVGGGAALIVLVAAFFFGIGQLSGPDDTPEVAGDVGDEPDDGDEEADQADDGDEADESEEPEEPEETDEPEDEPDEAADEPDESEETDETDEPDEPDDATSEAPAIDPAEITVQVLDGVGTDGGAAANEMAAQLEEAGYQVIAQNPAIAYDVTTVLWTTDAEERARQVASAVGAGEVRAQPGNLSDQVDVHVVVGADRA